MPAFNEHRRSVGFLRREGEAWACFLVTHPAESGRWHGYFSFRPPHGEAAEDEIRTADIFIEDSEAQIHEKARGLGRPLLSGLLASSLHTAARDGRGASKLRGQFRALLAADSRELAADWSTAAAPEDGTLDVIGLQSLYASYRLDQVAHFICLVEAGDFEDAVDRILEGERIDFAATDRIQFSMIVVEHIERLLPLPPFETWVQDFLSHRETYRVYAHTLHREGRLP